MAAPMVSSSEQSSPKIKRRPKKRKAVDHNTADDIASIHPNKKAHVPEFTEIEFKVGLRDSNTRFSVLDKFIEEAANFPVSSDYDIIERYCQSSAECHEVLTLLEVDSSQKRKPKELCSIFTVLESILVSIAGRLPKYKYVGLAVVRRILAGHIGSMFYMLQTQNKTNHIKVTVKLLSAMVMQGENAPRDILKQVDFQHHVFPALLERRDMREPMDVRACMLHFMLSFVIIGDKEVITQILGTKGFLNNIFPGLIADKLNVLEMVLPTLLDKVVKNADVSKTLKVRLCNQTALIHLAKLYRWTGPKKWQRGQKDAEDTVITEEQDQNIAKREDQQLIVDMVHELLLELCCDFKLGINFFDKTYGTSGKSLNHVLTVFLKSLHQPFLSSHLSELVVCVLKACPDQLVWYLPELKVSLAPRVSSKWIAAMNLLYKIYTAQLAVAPCMNLHGRVPIYKLVTMATANIVPPKETWAQILAAVRHKDSVIQHEGLAFLLLVLKRVKATLEFSKKDMPIYSASEMDSFASSLKDDIVKTCPDLATLLNCWSRAVKLVRTKTGDSKMDDSTMDVSKGAEDMNSDEEFDIDDVVSKGFPEVSRADHLLAVLQTLCEYQALFPENFAENFVNFSSLLEGVRTLAADDGTSTHELALVQLHLLRLLAESNLKQITWLKESFSGRSTLYLLLEMIVSSHSNPKMVSIATNLLQKLLISTGVFEHTEAEVAVWLRHLVACAITSPGVLPFVEQVFSDVIKDPFSYTEKVSEAVTEAMKTDVSMGMETASVTSASDQIIDSILSLDEVELDNDDSSHEPQDRRRDDQSSRFPFSALVPAALKLWKEKTDGKDEEEFTGVRTYLCRVIHSVLHHQTDPVPLCIMIHHHQATWLDPSCMRWLTPATSSGKKNTKSKKAVKPDVTGATSVSDLLTVTFNGGKDIILREDVQGQLRSLCQAISLEESEDVVKKILLYMRTHALSVLEDENHSAVVEFYLDLIAEVQEAILREPTKNDEDKDVDDNDDISNNSKVAAEPSEHFESLQVLKLSNNYALKKLVTLVANHPGIEQWFLWEKTIGTKEMAAKLGVKLRKVITSKSAKIFGCIPKEIALSMEFVLEKYRTKAYKEFEAHIERLRSRSILNGEGVDAMDALAALMSILPWCDVIKAAFYLGEVAATTPYGKQMLLSVLTHIISRMREDPALIRNITENLSLSTVSQLCNLASKGSMPVLDVILFDLVSLCPLFVMGMNEAYFRQCLSSPPEGAAHKMAAIVVAHSDAGRRWFRCYWSEQSKEERNSAKWDLLDVVLQYARCLVSDCEGGGKEIRQIHKVYMGDLFEWIQSDAASRDVDATEKHGLLTILTNTLDDTEANWSEYMSFAVGAPVMSVGQVQYIFMLSSAVERTSPALPVWEVCTGSCLTTLTNLLTGKGKAHHKSAISEIIMSLNNVLEKSQCDMKALAEVVHPVWSQLVKAGLKNMYEDLQMLKLLTHLVSVVYSCQSDDVIMPALVMYQMVMSHSCFLRIMLQEIPTRVKDALVELLLTVAQQNPSSCCQCSGHVTALLGAYGASLGKTDQKLLILITLYEKTGHSMDHHRPFLWGSKGVEHHSVKKSLGTSLRTRAESQQVMEILSTNRLARSSLHFPLQRKLMPDRVVPPEDMASYEDVYDPCFLLPLFSNMLQPGHLVDCFEFVQSGCLGYVITALSCHDRVLRGAAYHALGEFYHQAESSRFPAKDQVLYLLQVVKNSIPAANTKLAPIITTFLTRAIKLMITPDAPLYSAVNEFLLLKPAMDILNVPEFYKLFNSSAMEFKSDRSWILSLLVDGLRETADYRIFEKRYTFKIILSFYDSSLSDAHTQALVLRILHQAVCQRTVAADLIKRHGILSWINAAITTSVTNSENQGLLVDIMYTLWKTMLASREARTDSKSKLITEPKPNDDSKVESEPSAERAHHLPLAFTNEMMHLLLHLLQMMKSEEDMDVLNKLAACLGSILRHQQTTICAMNCELPPLRITINVTDILQMLHLWSSLVREEDQMWEIYGLLSGLGHIQGSDATTVKVPKRTRRRTLVNPEQPEETGVALGNYELQEKCVRSILQVIIHWLPMVEVFASTNVETSKEDVAAILYIASWSFNQCYGLFSDDLQLICDILQWFRMWVLNTSSVELRSLLVSDTKSARPVISQLLTVYGLCAKSLSRIMEADAKQKAATGGDMEVLKQTKVLTTEILSSVVDHVANGGSVQCRIQQNLNRNSFKKAWKVLSAVKGDHNALCLFIQELWMDAHKPSHFCTVVQDTVKNKVQ